MKCPHCQTDNPEGAEFCGRCGQSLQIEIICPQCGHKNPQSFKFCNKCRHALVEQAPTPTKPFSPEPTSFASGRYYEEGSLSLPYLAFVEAMRSYVLTRDIKDLREELGTGAADVARIVSEIRERLKVKPRPSVDPEEARYRLLQAVTGFLSNAATVQSLLVVLEDLHDADKGTLDMLTHISRNVAGASLLIVGTYRDVEVDRSK